MPDETPRFEVAPSTSWMRANLSPLKNFRHDLPAAIVVFLVALPLCLGIAKASGAPLIAGLIAGIVGGIVVAWLSGSPLAVSGPAAGLFVIVLDGITELGSWEAFLVTVILAGVIQLILGFARAGIIAYYFPSSVIKGLLAAIGIILILKQIPHAIGFDADYEGDMAFAQPDGRNTLTEIPYALGHFHLGATIISTVGLLLLILESKFARFKPKWLPGPLLVVGLGILFNEVFRTAAPALANEGMLLVELPTATSGTIFSAIASPDFSAFSNPAVYRIAAVLAVIASIETLLCIEAIDKLDPFRRVSNTNRELRAQGIGNIISGLLGGLPMTAVIVRGSTNVHSGGRTRMAAFGHGVLLLLSVLLVPGLLAKIPLASLAAVLLHVGYKLAPVGLFKRIYRLGWSQFVPFVVTILAILFTDLLIGVAIGMAVGIFYILRANLATPYFMHRRTDEETQGPRGSRHHIVIELSENVTFLNKASVNRALQEIPDGSLVEIDGRSALYIDRDVLEIVHEFAAGAQHRGVDVKLIGMPNADATAGELMQRWPIHTDGGDRPSERLRRTGVAE